MAAILNSAALKYPNHMYLSPLVVRPSSIRPTYLLLVKSYPIFFSLEIVASKIVLPTEQNIKDEKSGPCLLETTGSLKLQYIKYRYSLIYKIALKMYITKF